VTSPSQDDGESYSADRLPEVAQRKVDWIQFIRETLRIKVQLHESIGFMQSVEHFVLRHGKAFVEIAPPRSLPVWAQEPHGCFANCLRLADFSQSLTYVEGFAVVAGCRIEVDHAWCVDDLGRVVDPTWKQPGDGYFGVPFAASYVRRRLKAQLRTGWVDALLRAGDDDYRLVQGIEKSKWRKALGTAPGEARPSGAARQGSTGALSARAPRRKSSPPG